MMSNSLFHKTFLMLVAAAALTLTSSALAVGQSSPQKDEKREAKKEEKQEAAPQGTPVFWQEPTDIASRNLLLGPGGEEMKPDLSQVIWEGTEEGGYSVKWRVRDASGKKWVVKVGNEAQPETAAVRLTWAVGYVSEGNYLAPCVRIKGAPKTLK